MNGKILILAFLIQSSIGFVIAEAQQQTKAPRVAYLTGAYFSAITPRTEAFRQGLRELGYEQGRNIVIEYRYSDGKFDRLPNLAAELVNHKVDLVVTHGEAAIRALKRASNSIPIVVGVTGDLVGTGHAASLARPGGNVTGFVDTSPDLSGKRLELLREVLPKASRIAVLWNAGNKVKVLDFKETDMAAQAFGLRLQSLDVRSPEDFDKRFKAATMQRSSALLVLQDAL